MKLTNNTILITGGASGIGYQMAKVFSQRNNKVIITGRNQERLNKAKEELGDVITIQSDVSSPDDVRQLYAKVSDEFPELNILINNAGIMWTINLQDHAYSLEELTKEIDINVKGTIWMNDAFLPLLLKNKESATVTVSSGLAFVPLPISPIYCATKAGLHSYTQSLREQMRNKHLKVFELAPPATETELLGTFDEENLKGITVMSVEKLVEKFLIGFAKDQFEIRPGQANQMKFMSRFFPKFIFKQMSKTVDRMHGLI